LQARRTGIRERNGISLHFLLGGAVDDLLGSRCASGGKRMTRPRLVAPFVTAALLVSARGVVAGPATPAEQACIAGLNATGAGVAAAMAKDFVACVHDALRGKLAPGQSAEDCLSADRKGRVAKATAKSVAIEGARCGDPPPFGPTTAAAVDAAFTTLLGVHPVFGSDLDATLAAPGGGASCQLAVAKGMASLLGAHLRAFNGCVKAGMKGGTIVDAPSLAACRGVDTKGTVGKATAKLAATASARCAGVDLGVALPGECAAETPATVATCIDGRVSCDACRALDAADAITAACPHVFVDGVARTYCGTRPVTTQSVARQWDEDMLNAIRIDFPRPPIHARNLFHVSVAMWDAWAAYDPTADGYLVTEKHGSAHPVADRETTISFAAYRVLASRYAISPNAATSATAFRARMNALGYDPTFTDALGDSPASVGNRIAAAVIAYGLSDGSNESSNYADPTYTPVNDPLIVKLPGTTMIDPNRWQPLALDVQIGQNGIPIPGKIQIFVGPQWGGVLPFAIDFPSIVPGPPPRVHDAATDADFKQQALEVIRFSSRLTPDDPTMIDISPASYGNNPLGTNDGTGYGVNPVTGQPYVPEVVKRGDLGRVLAEFWADGPTSETPPGHWNTIANYVVDNPLFERRFEGTGPILDPLEWDVKMYLAVNGAVHDAAIGAWGTKRVYDSVRPISMIRWMGGLGQSSDPLGPSYHPDGLPLEPGLVEVITAASSAPGERHEALAGYVGEVAILAWPGAPADPLTQYSGVHWMRAKEWVPYQRSTFVTPPFAGYISGHSTYSRSAAEVLRRLTGTPYFPGGLGEFTAPQDNFLAFEVGPSTTVTLQWATYYDAADQAGISRLWGGIHIRADDFAGRILGSTIGADAFDRARTHFDGTATP
jgi:hypothetical protein